MKIEKKWRRVVKLHQTQIEQTPTNDRNPADSVMGGANQRSTRDHCASRFEIQDLRLRAAGRWQGSRWLAHAYGRNPGLRGPMLYRGLEQPRRPRLAVRAKSFGDLTRKAIIQINAYWARLAFSGQVTPPKQLPDGASILDVVKANRNAIGYLDRTPNDAGVRVVLAIPARVQ